MYTKTVYSEVTVSFPADNTNGPAGAVATVTAPGETAWTADPDPDWRRYGSGERADGHSGGGHSATVQLPGKPLWASLS